MTPLISRHRPQIEALCARHHVRSLDLFGSGVDAKASGEPPDVDLLVTFDQMEAGDLADAYLGLLDDLERLLGRQVDLVVERAITNPHFRESVMQTKVSLYAAA